MIMSRLTMPPPTSPLSLVQHKAFETIRTRNGMRGRWYSEWRGQNVKNDINPRLSREQFVHTAHPGIVEGFEAFTAGLLRLCTVWWVHTDRPQWARYHCHKQQQDITPAVNCMRKIIQLSKQSRTRFEFRTFLRHNSNAVEKEMHKFICERWTNIYHMLIHSENLASLIYSELVSE